ncbi:MBL fold metallo-hydrolase [Natronorubrum sp. JWXQ-INN-674]|uniref:MBL fold metallo-hydrolase n=1 Tax=Natronorubrum halalkaliphilum TaxID=2691917 RepID=A0A6B0VT92_9EURY|nr:MBL fold metallo-hydrolase [Natronorubrum halalkaliphilum]MXV64012.1 MBL fold metallo-hydrolase [Natronorubrum halalkaliphilum]
MDTDTGGTCRSDRGVSTVHRLEFDVSWPPRNVAAYVVDGPEPILIDAGTPTETGESELEASLERGGYALADVDHVLVTHPHSDHLGQASTLREAGATIHAPAAALERLERDPETVRSTVRETAVEVGYRGDDVDGIVDDALESFRRDRRLLDPDATRPIEANATFSVGDRQFRSLETPGHEITHLSFETVLEGESALFAGDALIKPFRAGAFHVGIDHGAGEAIDQYYDAMDRLLETTATRVFPGHGPTFEDPHRIVGLTRKRLDRLLEETRAALAEIEPATALSVAEERAGSSRYLAPVLDTIGALGTLERRGVVTSEREGGVRYYRIE